MTIVPTSRAVEAAARSLWTRQARHLGVPWTKLEGPLQDQWRALAHGALSAAAFADQKHSPNRLDG